VRLSEKCLTRPKKWEHSLNMSTQRSQKAVSGSARCGTVIAVLLMLPFVSAKAEWIEKPTPEFPMGVYYQGLEGSVVVSLTIDNSGRVTSSRVIRSSGHPILDRLATAASMKWRLAPHSVVPTDLNVGRLQLIRFRQSNSGYAKSNVPGSSPFWKEVRWRDL
jgi:TonB family protein